MSPRRPAVDAPHPRRRVCAIASLLGLVGRVAATAADPGAGLAAAVDLLEPPPSADGAAAATVAESPTRRAAAEEEDAVEVGEDNEDVDDDDSDDISIVKLGKKPLSQFRNCYLTAPLSPDFGCKLLAETKGESFKKNKFGQETTAKRKCLARVRALGGDTFVFRPYVCQVWRCGTRHTLRASAAPRHAPPPSTTAPPTTTAGPPISGPPAQPLPVRPPTTYSNVSFKGFHGRWLRVLPDGYIDVNGTSAGKKEAWFQVARNDDGTVSLFFNGRHNRGWVTAFPNGPLRVQASIIDDWEKLKLSWHRNHTVAFKTFHSQYVSDRFHVALSIAPVADDWEYFFVVNHTRIRGRKLSESELAEEEEEAEDDEELEDVSDYVKPDKRLEVYSDLCGFQEVTGGREGHLRRAPIFVKLWEWNYADIGRECKEYLGPNGFDAVQLSPVTEHVQGPTWWTKYQPISFGLDSRSGTTAEFKAMVAECRAAGVEVMVDLIINHIATPCRAANHLPANATNKLPCTGWNGSAYGKRRLGGARGWDKASPEYFHHKPGHPDRGLCYVGPPSFLCGSLVTTDCSCCNCDMYGLPDWNTQLDEVRYIHYRHVKELHDAGVTMLRVDAALYENVTETTSTLNLFPWDYVYMEWWGEFPVGIHDEYIGHYRDVALRWKITNKLATEANLTVFREVLDLDYGTFGVQNEKTVYPIGFHDQRTPEADMEIGTYKNGLEYHQQQKFFMAWPWAERIMMWSGYSYTDVNQGPPGCEHGHRLCAPRSVYDESGEPSCIDTPTESPLAVSLAQSRRWVCEHRWAGVAGLVGFRKACRGLPMHKVHIHGNSTGRLAFKVGHSCLVALVKGTNKKNPQGYGHIGDWNLKGLATHLPTGRYCDVAQLSVRWGKGVTCPKEVVVDEDGSIASGAVREGDILAIYTGARISDGHAPPKRLRGEQ